ncbi:DMT family transporter [Thalassospira sp.]|uniref:DMT family transporter n=1 Tax=Thalassospira sp. TaxID=1912094 RepID=UPI0027377A19|nr:DMT family transporter [Thalassospira sp.]MDP2698220.1 DMT family transporter [Thalassospira sp.]
MTTTVFLAVIAAALLHAVWNALVKGGVDKHLGMAAVVLGHTPIALVLLPFIPLPAAESWPYMVASIALHFGYQVFLLQSYRLGDLTQVYPIARGSAPLMVAAISTLFLGVTLQSLELLAICIIGTGIMSLSLARRSDGLRNVNAAFLALMTGCFICGYSLVDGYGARLAGTSLGYYAWHTLGNTIAFTLYIRLSRPGLLRDLPKKGKRVFIIGGSASFVAYAMVMWAFTQAPIPLVTALRETSIVFALLIGVFFLREKLNLVKVFSAMVTLFGAALLRFVR